MQYKHGDIVLTKDGMLGILLVYHDPGNEYILELISSKARSGWNKNQDKKLVNYSSQALSEFWYINLSKIEKKVTSYEEACSIINTIFNKELPTNFSLVDLFSTNVQDNIIKKDTYIVFTESLFNNTEYLKNYCYKQREDKDYFISQLDSKGDRYNGWGIISPLKEHEKFLYAWRYGTKEEGEEYERLQKPFDVTTLSNVSPEFITKKDINLLVSGTVGYLNNGPKKSVPIIETRNKEAKLMKVNAEVGQLLKTTTRTNKLFIIKI